MFTTQQRQAFFLEMHRIIEETASATAGDLASGSVTEPVYPPNGGFSPAEYSAISRLAGDDVLEAAMRKLIASAIGSSLHQVFSIIDGIADPEVSDVGWGVFAIQQVEDGEEEDCNLHLDLYDSYWEWQKQRPDPGWKLDVSSPKPSLNSNPILTTPVRGVLLSQQR